MEFWKTHEKLRLVLIPVLFVVGFAIVIYGWRLTGQMAGLGLMLLGICFLLAALYIYNKPFARPRKKK